MEQFFGEAILGLATALAVAFVALVRRIDNKHGAAGARIGKVQDENTDLKARIAVLENKTGALEKNTENNACKADIREMEVRLTKRIDDLAAELKEARK